MYIVCHLLSKHWLEYYIIYTFAESYDSLYVNFNRLLKRLISFYIFIVLISPSAVDNHFTFVLFLSFWGHQKYNTFFWLSIIPFQLLIVNTCSWCCHVFSFLLYHDIFQYFMGTCWKKIDHWVYIVCVYTSYMTLLKELSSLCVVVLNVTSAWECICLCYGNVLCLQEFKF